MGGASRTGRDGSGGGGGSGGSNGSGGSDGRSGNNGRYGSDRSGGIAPDPPKGDNLEKRLMGGVGIMGEV